MSLHDTHFQPLRGLDLSVFVDLTCPKPKNPNEAHVLEHPNRALRSHGGFYVCEAFRKHIFPSLRPRPVAPEEKRLHVWCMKHNFPWKEVLKIFEGRNHPVPWWVIRPLLAYDDRGEETRIVPNQNGGVVFVMRTLDQDQKDTLHLVRLSVSFLGLGSDYRVSVIDKDETPLCHEGQILLSVE